MAFSNFCTSGMSGVKSGRRFLEASNHIDRDDSTAKFLLEQLSLSSSIGFSLKELRKLEELVQEKKIKQNFWRLGMDEGQPSLFSMIS
ncbi:hypothetical protein [Nostoc sp.]|uniref:hypothetical protein n=1 Tax=Nostoc sp. TaxID=1180 RepID=UPI002FFD2774